MKKIVKLELYNIVPFENHPFTVKKDDSFQELKESIKENGLLEPLLVRPKKYGRYELISGHRRKLALELNGTKEADCYVEDLTDDEAIIKMVDSNIHRTLILPSVSLCPHSEPASLPLESAISAGTVEPSDNLISTQSPTVPNLVDNATK